MFSIIHVPIDVRIELEIEDIHENEFILMVWFSLAKKIRKLESITQMLNSFTDYQAVPMIGPNVETSEINMQSIYGSTDYCNILCSLYYTQIYLNACVLQHIVARLLRDVYVNHIM